jgi:sec-independent protein translocase protein TatA
MFGLEPWHIVLLLAVVLVFFGPKRLPEIGKSVGDTIREFRKATTDVANSVTSAPAPPPVEPTTAPTATPPATANPAPPDQAPAAVPAAPAAAAPVGVPSAATVERPTPDASGEPGAPRPDAVGPNPPAGTAG